MDGVWIEPTIVDYLMIFSGERYDVLIHANVTSENDDFIICAETLEINSTTKLFRGDHLAQAILHYDRPGSSIPNSTQYSSISESSIPVSTKCTASSPCTVLNCPLKNFADFFNLTCIPFDQTRLLFPYMENDDKLPDASQVTDSERLIFVFSFEGSRSADSINSRHFVSPSIPFTLLNSSQLAEVQRNEFCKNLDDPNTCNRANPGSRECACTHVRTIAGGHTIQLVLANVGPFGYYESHPVHLHGHYFHVADIQYGNYSEEGRMTDANDDIDCQSTSRYCPSPIWRNRQDPYADTGKISRFAPLRDTIVVPAGGYAVVYFKSDNPGWWFLHCHVLDHMIEGMSVMLYETGDSNPPPNGFESCGNFTLSVLEYTKAITGDTPSSTPSSTFSTPSPTFSTPSPTSSTPSPTPSAANTTVNYMLVLVIMVLCGGVLVII